MCTLTARSPSTKLPRIPASPSWVIVVSGAGAVADVTGRVSAKCWSSVNPNCAEREGSAESASSSACATPARATRQSATRIPALWRRSLTPKTTRPTSRWAVRHRKSCLLRVFRLQLVQLAAELVTERRATGVARVEALGLGHLLRAVRALDRQADLALRRVGVKDLNLHGRDPESDKKGGRREEREKGEGGGG